MKNLQNTANTIAKHSLLTCAAVAALLTSACAVDEKWRDNVANRIASPAWMVEREVGTGGSPLMTFERMHTRDQGATVYIEGNGEARMSSASFNPTPRNPVALHLASKDKSENLAYVGQPCQHVNTDCDAQDWFANQYNVGTIESFNETLDGIKRRYGVTSFNLVGYDGGATTAALLAAERTDVASLRTVAGLFDMGALTPSISALRSVPQHHFIGGQDQVAPPAELYKYVQAIGESECLEYTLVQEAAHEKGWVNIWPDLIQSRPPECVAPPEPIFVPIQKPDPIFVPRMSGKGQK